MTAAGAALAMAGRLAVRAIGVVAGVRLSILIFHRVLPRPDPLFPLEMDARRFDRLMALVARTFTVLPLSEAVRRLADRSLPADALSITFDDGYADNHDIAMPILQRHGLSACFFVATGFLDGGRMFNDSVIECVRHTKRDSVDLGEFGLGTCELRSPEQRAGVIGKLLPVVKYLSPQDRQGALDRIQHVFQARDLPNDLMMTRSQVQAMYLGGMEIGAHTVQHPILCTMDDDRVVEEVSISRAELETLTDAPVTLFAYPNGRPDHDYASRHAQLVRRLGFVAAVSTAPGTAGYGADPYQLPRFTPWDCADTRWMIRLVTARRRQPFLVAAPAS